MTIESFKKLQAVRAKNKNKQEKTFSMDLIFRFNWMFLDEQVSYGGSKIARFL